MVLIMYASTAAFAIKEHRLGYPALHSAGLAELTHFIQKDAV